MNKNSTNNNNNNNAVSSPPPSCLETKITSMFENLLDYVMEGYLFPEDDFVTRIRKLFLVVCGPTAFFGLTGIFYLIQASNKGDSNGSEDRRALIAVGVSVTIWGIITGSCVIYSLVTKTASSLIASLPLWLFIASTIVQDTFVDFIYANMAYLTIASIGISCQLDYSYVMLLLCSVLTAFNAVRDSFELEALQISRYHGSAAERAIFAMPAILMVLAVPGLLITVIQAQYKLLRSSQKTVDIAQEISTHLIAYNTDAVKDTLEEAGEDKVVYDEETGEEKKRIQSEVSKELISAFQKMNENLLKYKPFLPSYVLPQEEVIEEDEDRLMLYVQSQDEDDDDVKRRSRKQSAALGTKKSRRSSKDSQCSIEIHSQASCTTTKGKEDFDKRSWEHGLESDEEIAKKSAPKQQQNSFLRGNFVERMVLCRVSLNKLPEFIISSFQTENRTSKRFLKDTSDRFNKIIEILLDTAHSDSASIHSMIGDSMLLTFNAAQKTAQSDAKAMKFLTTCESLIRKEVTNHVNEIERENVANNQTEMMPVVKTDGSSLLDRLNQHRVLLSGAMVNGSCFAQVGGNAKRQTFMLSSFSQQETFERACEVGEKNGFVVVSRTIFHNNQHEYEFRGCGIALPFEYQHLIHKQEYILRLETTGGLVHSAGGERENHFNSGAAATATTTANEASSAETMPNRPAESELSDSQNQTAVTSGRSSSAVSSSHHHQHGAPSSVFMVQPLYEVVCKKVVGAKNREEDWMYNNHLENSIKETEEERGNRRRFELSMKLNETVSFLGRGKVSEARRVLQETKNDYCDEVERVRPFKLLNEYVVLVGDMMKEEMKIEKSV